VLRGGYDKQAGAWTFGPVAEIQYTYAGINQFSEAGSLAPLTISSQTISSLQTRLGAHVVCVGKVGKVTFLPELRLEWQHEYLNENGSQIDSQFVNGPGTLFSVYGPATGHDSLRVDSGVSVLWSPRFSTYLYYDGQFGQGYLMNSISAGVRLEF